MTSRVLVTVPVGKVETGVMKIGQKIVVLPGRSGTGIAGEVRSIEAHHEQLNEAEAGDNVGVNLRGVGKKRYGSRRRYL